jgi:Phage integrase central domain
MKHRKPYPYLHEITDRHGHPRAYLRKPGCPSVALPLPVGSRAFLEAYQAALEAEPEPIMGKAKPRTIAALVDIYCHSRKWTTLSPSSQRSYRYTLESFVAEHGHRRVDQMEAKHVAAIMEARAETPVSANRIRKLLQAMMKIAIMQGWRKDNPCLAVENFKIKSKGHRTWADDEIGTYHRHRAATRLRATAEHRAARLGRGEDGTQAHQGWLHHHHPEEKRRHRRGHHSHLARAQGGAR